MQRTEFERWWDKNETRFKKELEDDVMRLGGMTLFKTAELAWEASFEKRDKKAKAIRDSLIKEAQLLRKDHPSKDCRVFAKNVLKFLYRLEPS